MKKEQLKIIDEEIKEIEKEKELKEIVGNIKGIFGCLGIILCIILLYVCWPLAIVLFIIILCMSYTENKPKLKSNL